MKALSSSMLLVLPLLALAACGVSEPQEEQRIVPVGINPVTGQRIDVTPGLNDKEPDTCHAADVAYLIGQPESAIAAAGIMRPTRVVSINSIVSQEEYDSFRINFKLDATGTVVAINCG